MSTGRLWLFNLISSLLPPTRCYPFKAALLRWCGAKVGENVRLVSGVKVLGDGELEIGDDVFIGLETVLSVRGSTRVKISSRVDIAPRVTILTGSHEIDALGEHVAGKGFGADISIGEGSWLAACVTILPGVVVPPRTLIAAGSVVTKTIPAGEFCQLVAGVPAKIVKTYQ